MRPDEKKIESEPVKTKILYLQEWEVNAFQSTVLLFQQTYQS
jgi:hypothetical protein